VQTKKHFIFYISLLASVIFHCLLFMMISFKTSRINSETGKEPERYISLVNISLLEPPLVEIQVVLSAPAVLPNTVPDEAPAENFIVIEEPPHLTEWESETAIAIGADTQMVSETAVAISAERRFEAANGAAARTAEYVSRNYNYIQRRIGNKLVYPPQARRAGMQGITELGFTIHEDGSISGVTVRASSGYAILDEAAAAAVFAAAPFPRPHTPARIAIPISFKLR
jgi:periplasmic protein TonB